MAGAGNPAWSAHRAAVASRRLRALVIRLQGCLPDLPQAPARLLGLRAGLLGRPALSAAATARALRVTVSAEGRLERRALTALRGAAANGCGPSGAGSGSASGSTLAAGVTSQLSPRPAIASSPAGPGSAGSTQAAHAGVSRHGVTRSAASGTPPAAQSMPDMIERASTPGWALISALTALALAGAFALLRAYRGPAPAAVRTADGRSPLPPAPASATAPSASSAPPVAPEPPVTPSPSPPAAPVAVASTAAAAPARVPPPARQSAPTPAEPRSWGRHELELAAVTLTAIGGGAVRLISLARRRSGRRR